MYKITGNNISTPTSSKNFQSRTILEPTTNIELVIFVSANNLEICYYHATKTMLLRNNLFGRN